MSDLFNNVPVDGWTRFALDALWQGAVVGMIAWIAARLLVRWPAARAGLMWLAMVCCVAMPLASATIRLAGWGVLSGQTTASAAVAGQGGLGPDDWDYLDSLAAQTGTSLSAGPARDPVLGHALPWQSVAAVLWAVASGILVVRLLLSVLRVWQMTRTAVACRAEQILAAAKAAAQRVGLRRVPEVVHSRSVTAPMVLAFTRPRLLTPPPERQRDTATDWLAVFCHELAHLRRHDIWKGLVARAVTALLPWQPVLWLLRREYDRACEEACDDWAVSAGADPTALASSLAQWIPRKAPAPALGAAGPSAMRHRIERLLATEATPRPRAGLLWHVGSTLAALVVVATTALAQTRQPPPASAAERQKPPEEIDDLTETGVDSPVDFRIRPGDTIRLEKVQNAPRPPHRVGVYDVLRVRVPGSLDKTPMQPIDGCYLVEGEGVLDLGPTYGRVRVAGLTIEAAAAAVTRDLSEALERPEAFVSLAQNARTTTVTGLYRVGPDGTINLRRYGVVCVAGKTLGAARAAVQEHLAPHFERLRILVTAEPHRDSRPPSAPTDSQKPIRHGEPPTAANMVPLPPHRIAPPDCVSIFIELPQQSAVDAKHALSGQYLVGPDGAVYLREYGRVSLAGKTQEEARKEVKKHLARYFEAPEVGLEIVAVNSRFCYVILDDAESGDRIHKLPAIGKQTVADALDQVEDLPRLSERKIWIGRPAARHGASYQKLRVNWEAITKGADAATNYQILPGDRVFITERGSEL